MDGIQSVKANELVVALGILARAQEFKAHTRGPGANDDELLELMTSVREAAHAFQAVCQPAQ